MVDVFIILNNVQFEKNNYQNRYLTRGNWVTKSVSHGMELIKDKKYSSGQSLNDLNIKWINVIKDTLEIETQIKFPRWGSSDNKTMRLIQEIKMVGGSIYVTNQDAKNKYLDEELMRTNGIEIEYCNVPKHLQIHTFEAFEQFGIDGCIKQLESARNKCQEQLIS